MGSVFDREHPFRKDAVAVTQLRIATDGLDEVCGTTYERLKAEYPKALSELMRFANTVFGPDESTVRQLFLDGKMVTYAIQFTMKDYEFFAQELRIDRPQAQE